MKRTIGFILFLVHLFLIIGCSDVKEMTWQEKFVKTLLVFGHRNWILIADSAYPAQSRSSIETLATGENQLDLVKAVLEAIETCNHIRANVYLDTEMQYISEQDVEGIDQYRKDLKNLLADQIQMSLPHDQLIAKLDEVAQMFHVLVLKSELTLPYTSVFIELECGYWSAEKENRLQQAIKLGKIKK